MKRIGILGHVGTRNLGDEAIIAAVIQGVTRHVGHAEISGFTANPEDTTARHHITAYPIRRLGKPSHLPYRTTTSETASRSTRQIKNALRKVPVLYSLLTSLRDIAHTLHAVLAEAWFLVRCYRLLNGTAVLIIAGSQQLSDNIGGPWAFPYTLFKWSMIARAARTKVAFLSVGAGPITSPLSKRFLRSALAAASYRSYRDASSRRLIAEIGGPTHDLIIPDLAYSLKIAAPPHLSSRPVNSSVVGINPMPLYHPQFWYQAHTAKYQQYVRTLAAFTLWLIDSGHDVLFYPTQLRADPPVINDIRSILRSTGPVGFERRIVDRPIDSFEDLMSAIAITDIVVPTRFHGILLAFLLHKPVLGIAYHPKTRDLMAQMGQADYVVDVHALDLAELKDRFIALTARKERSARQIEVQTALCRESLATQYEAIAALLSDAGVTPSPLGAHGAPRVYPRSAPSTRDNRVALKSALSDRRF